MLKTLCTISGLVIGLSLITSSAQAQCPALTTYTSNTHFDDPVNASKVRVNDSISGELRLDGPTPLYPYVNVACSTRGTIVRINVNSGAILGEYWTAPDNRRRNPSRTTVDHKGNVWVSNRNEPENFDLVQKGSITRVALVIGGRRVNANHTSNPQGPYLLDDPPGAAITYCSVGAGPNGGRRGSGHLHSERHACFQSGFGDGTA